MIPRASDAGVPFAWVAADSVSGVGAVEMALRRAGKGDGLGVNTTSRFNSRGAKPPVAGIAAALAGALDPAASVDQGPSDLPPRTMMSKRREPALASASSNPLHT